MSDQLAQALKNLLTQRKKEALQRGLGEIPELVFHRGKGQVIENYIRRVFKRILKKAGLREIRIHDLRHTCALLLLSEGGKPCLRQRTAWTFQHPDHGGHLWTHNSR